MNDTVSTPVTEPVAEPATEIAGEAAAADPTGLPANLDELRLPVWFFGFEAVFACAFDLIKAYPPLWPALVALVVVNIALSLTMMRKRLKLARSLWRGKETRKVAIGLVALRIGSHFALQAVGVEVSGTAAHLAFAAVMGGVTVGLLAFSQQTALRTLAASRAKL